MEQPSLGAAADTGGCCMEGKGENVSQLLTLTLLWRERHGGQGQRGFFLFQCVINSKPLLVPSRGINFLFLFFSSF